MVITTAMIKYLVVVSAAVQVVHHHYCPTRVIVNHCPEINNGIRKWHLCHNECIALLVALQHSKGDAN